MSKNVLVIERDFETSRQIAKALEGEGYFVFTASSAEAGLVMARRVKPSLLFLNLSMRDAGGVEFLKKLRALDFLHNVPILLLTQKQEEYETRYGDIYGIVNFVGVPVNESEVIAKSKASIEQIPVHELPVKDENKDENLPSQNAGAGRSLLSGPAATQGGGSQDENDREAPQDGPALEDEGLPAKSESQPRKNENMIVRIDNRAGEDEPGEGREVFFAGQPEPSTGGVKDEAASGGDDESFNIAGADADSGGEEGGEYGFEAHMKEAPGLFEEKKETQTDTDAPMEGAIADSPPADHLTPDERKGSMEDITPSAFYGQKKKKAVVSKGVLWMLAIVLLGAASSFFFFMYMSPKTDIRKEQAAAPVSAENQPVIVEQNTPAVAAAAVNTNTPEQQKPLAALNKTVLQQNRKQPFGQKGSQVAAMNHAIVVQAKPNSQVKPAGPKPVAKNQENQKVLPQKTVQAPLNKKVVSASAGSAKVRAQKRKSPGYWALLEQEEAQLKAHDSGRGIIKHGKPAEKAAPKVLTKKRKIPASHGTYSLQVGAFESRVNAQKLTGKLRSEGFKTYVLESRQAGKKPIYKVLVGRFSTPAAGNAAARKLGRDGLKAFHYYE